MRTEKSRLEVAGARTFPFILLAAGLCVYSVVSGGDRHSGTPTVHHAEAEKDNFGYPHPLGSSHASAGLSRRPLALHDPQSEAEGKQVKGNVPGQFEALLYSDLADGSIIVGEDPNFITAVSSGPKSLSGSKTSVYVSSNIYSSDLVPSDPAVYFESPDIPSAPARVVLQQYIGEPEDWRHGSLQSTFADDGAKRRPVSSMQMQRVKHSAMLLTEENQGVIDDSWAFDGQAKAGGDTRSVADPAYGMSDPGILGVFDDPHFVTPQE